MECASIDIGTNTVRLLVAYVNTENEIMNTLALKRVVTRLGGGYTEEGGITKESAERTFKVLETFAQIISDFGVEDVKATATSVVRRSNNKDWFVDEAFKRSGIKIEVIDGEKEAELSMIGVNSVIDSSELQKPFIVDIGGGSTEFIATKDSKVAGKWSLDLGVVHLTEMYLENTKDGKPTDDDIKTMTDDVRNTLEDLKEKMVADGVRILDYLGDSSATLVGTAGTVTTLAALDQEMSVYDVSKINNYILRKEAVEEILEHLISLTLKEREELIAIEKGREDLIIAGVVIINSIMNAFEFTSLRVSDAGLLEGILIDKIEKYKTK